MAVFTWSQSGCEIIKTELKWNVPVPFLKIIDANGKNLRSESFFCAKETPEHQWRLHVHDVIRYLHINVYHYNSKKQAVIIGDPAVLVKFAIVDRHGQKGFQQMLSSHSNSKYVQFVLAKQDVINSKCQQMDGSLTFYCKIQSFIKIGNDVRRPKFSYVKSINYSDQLTTQLEGLLDNTKFSDFTFALRGREFKVHKAILASRSEVFEAMFEHPFKENLTNRVEIEDIEPDVFHVLLRFIYTGQVSLAEMGTFAVGLYAAADKYMLNELKIACENHLVRRPMSADYCSELLFFTSKYPAEHLKQEAIKFFRLYPVEVMKTDGWKRAKQENLNWVSEMLKILHPAANANPEEELPSKKMRLES